MSVSPSEDNAPPGHELDYEVTVTNTGSSTDNYDLAVTDNAGWSPTLDESLFENVESGESRKTTLRVTIPEGTEIGTQDNITVTTTSQESTQVSDNESCIAISAPLLRSVETSASPGSKEGSPGSNLKYSITVTNTGNVTDNYDLTANNDENWNLSLGKNSVKNVSSGGENTTTLTVEIPDNADLIGLTNTIIVTAVSQENSSINDSGTSTAKVVEEPVGGIFHPADRERLEEQGEKALTAFVIPLVILFGIITFSVWWRKRE
ncbi:hypothetical protein AKJ54_00390 [candidate division MSBL1 archaeon SCGC-AAA382K21]|uniref:VWA7 Ig-like domain-containing protein n=1 Tax=candidate division MSBL1 archaeon SCGC-AAA382K21 TaxID=1698283 RepID=A0A133VLQ6_9EURY|nr:hypothetical protein AKJ54_00390 [candidate division MSBL1 archaeon SCGC-AAA382K21]